MSIIEYAQKHSARDAARALVNRRLGQFGLHIDDLPDGVGMDSIVTDLEGIVQSGVDAGRIDMEAIRETLDEGLNDDTILSLITG